MRHFETEQRDIKEGSGLATHAVLFSGAIYAAFA
jgi:hypothetical protein